MMRGGSASTSQNLMRARVVAQFAAIVAGDGGAVDQAALEAFPFPSRENGDGSVFRRSMIGSAGRSLFFGIVL